MALLPSLKVGITYLEHCRIVAADERLAFVRSDDALQRHFSIPYGNQAVLLLGPGTSLTQAAARKLAEGEVLVGFTSGGATPIFYAALNEYRKTKYMQSWIAMWADKSLRHAAAQKAQLLRCDFADKHFAKNCNNLVDPTPFTARYREAIFACETIPQLLGHEANFAKSLYGELARAVGHTGFTRQPRAEDKFNQLLDQGNYLAYGLSAAALWVLGIPHGFPLMHGKTRRGALVFDIADLVKDSCVMTTAFVCASKGQVGMEFRKACIAALHDSKSLKFMFNAIKEMA